MNKTKTNLLSRSSETTLYLTNIRTFQQSEKVREAIFSSRKKHFGKPFQIRTSPSRFCGRFKSAFIKVNNLGKAYLVNINGIPCKLWSCPNCGPKKATKLKYELIKLIKLNNLDHLLTLTLNPAFIPATYKQSGNRTGSYITYLFNRYMLTLKRKMKREIRYIWVKEFQKNGNAHLHILFNNYLPIKYLRKEWVRIGGGVEMNIQRVRNIKAMAIYVTGYIVKGLKNTSSNTNGLICGEKRYSISHSCLKPKKQLNPLTKITKISELSPYLSADKIMEVYNMLQNPDITKKELILAPHQESLNL